MLNIFSWESSVSWVARSRNFLPKSPGKPRQKTRNKTVMADQWSDLLLTETPEVDERLQEEDKRGQSCEPEEEG